MLAVQISITRFVSYDQPGFVECKMVDAWGHEWSFIEKSPVVSEDWPFADSEYPVPGVIACEVTKKWHDATGREIFTIDTERPWGVEATTGEMSFDVLPAQIIEI